MASSFCRIFLVIAILIAPQRGKLNLFLYKCSLLKEFLFSSPKKSGDLSKSNSRLISSICVSTMALNLEQASPSAVQRKPSVDWY